MGQIPSELKYTEEHEWAKKDGDCIIIGITDFAQSSLGDIVFVELPEVGKSLEKASSFGVVESIKSVSDLYCPISGEVSEVNQAIIDGPELLNQDPYENWMIKIKPKNMQDLESLMSSSEYQKICEEH